MSEKYHKKYHSPDLLIFGGQDSFILGDLARQNQRNTHSRFVSFV